MSFLPRLLLIAVVLGTAPLAAAQIGNRPTSSPYPDDRIIAGASYFVYTESGAPTMEILVVRTAGPGGIYRVTQGTSLTELLALSGGTAPPDEITERTIRQSVIRVLRPSGDARSVIYEASPEQLLREPGRHPGLANGDLVEVLTTIEERPRRTTLAERLAVISSLTSFASFIAILVQTF